MNSDNSMQKLAACTGSVNQSRQAARQLLRPDDCLAGASPNQPAHDSRSARCSGLIFESVQVAYCQARRRRSGLLVLQSVHW